MTEKHRILIVEDDEKMALGLKFNLIQEGYLVDHAETGEKAVEFVKHENYSVILLDLMLPMMQGSEVLKRIREDGVVTSTIILSARDSREDILWGLEQGADDYLPKPFDLDILLAKIASFIRGRNWLQKKVNRSKQEKIAHFGNCWVNFENSMAFNGKDEFRLSTKETLIMQVLLAKKGKAVSRQEFMEKVWGTQQQLQTRTLDTFIHHLRKRFEKKSRHPKHILKVQGEGYRLVE